MVRQSAAAWLGACLLASALGGGVTSSRAEGPPPAPPRKSIFDFDDDDKARTTPPPPTTPPGTPPPTLESKPTPPTTPQTPPETKPGDPPPAGGREKLKLTPPAGSENARAPVAAAGTAGKPAMAVPDAKAQEKALRAVKEQFKAEYRATGAERAAAARKLLDAGVEVSGDPDAGFVLLREARDMAASAGDARTGLAAARQLAGRYAVDLTEMGLGVLSAASRNATTADRAAEVASVAMTLLGRAAEAQQFDLAIRIAAVAEASARVMRSGALSGNVQAITKDLRARKLVADKLPAALDALRKNPSDPEACTVVGRNACLEEGNWADGLAFLAKCSDVGLKNLAARELSPPAEAAGQAELGNQWWTAAQAQPVTARLRMQERAAYWYAKAVPGLVGARREQAAARVASAGRVLPAVVLMTLPVAAADPARARREREALGGGEPLGRNKVDESVVVPAGKPYVLAGNVDVPDKGGRVDVTLGPGAELRGGRLYLSGRGHLVLRGSADKPAVLRNVHVSMDLNGSFDAEYAVLDNCTFSKSGGWYAYHSSKWTFKNCVLYRCKFAGLGGVDYGFRIDACRLIGMQWPEASQRRDPEKEYNHLDRLRRDWNLIRRSEFVDCTVPPTVAWCAVDSGFVGCRFVPGEAFEGAADFEWPAFVAETAGEPPQAVFDARPGTRGRVKVVPLERPVELPVVGPRAIPEVGYAIRAVTKNE